VAAAVNPPYFEPTGYFSSSVFRSIKPLETRSIDIGAHMKRHIAFRLKQLPVLRNVFYDRPSELNIGTFGGFQVAYRKGTADEVVIAHSFDHDEFFTGVPEYQAARNHIVIDIGAHIGTFSLLASSKVPLGKVYAIEPSEDTFHFLRVNVALNRAINVSVHHLAIMAERGVATLYHDAGNWGHSVVKRLSPRSEQVAACSLSDFMEDNGIQQCDFMKLNCEGAEFPILLNTPPDVLGRFGALLVLYHSDLWEQNTPQELLVHLTASGFKWDVRNQTKMRGWIVAINSSASMPQVGSVTLGHCEQRQLGS
jgi:FkbM family methyltransferase